MHRRTPPSLPEQASPSPVSLRATQATICPSTPPLCLRGPPPAWRHSPVLSSSKVAVVSVGTQHLPPGALATGAPLRAILCFLQLVGLLDLKKHNKKGKKATRDLSRGPTLAGTDGWTPPPIPPVLTHSYQPSPKDTGQTPHETPHEWPQGGGAAAAAVCGSPIAPCPVGPFRG